MKTTAWLALAVSLLAGASTLAAAEPGRPNIVLVMPDDVGYGDFACDGNPVIHTPRIDAFARQSVRFTDFHVSPTCAPTRCSLMTGRHEFKSGVTHTINERERMSPKATTIAQVLKVGRLHHGHLRQVASRRRGRPISPKNEGSTRCISTGQGGSARRIPEAAATLRATCIRTPP